MRLFIPIVLFSVSVCFADSPAVYRDRIRAYVFSKGVDADGEMSSGRLVLGSRGGRDLYVASWDVPGVPRPLDGELPSYSDSVAILEGVAESKELARQAAKSEAQKELENEYFDTVDAIYAEVKEDAPALEEARNRGAVRAKVSAARGKKGGGGGGSPATADDLLEVNELRLRLLDLDAELKTYDTHWLSRAKRHDLE